MIYIWIILFYLKKLRMYNFCTLFDSNYLTRGLAMYESLTEHIEVFHLYIFAFDAKSYSILQKLNLLNVTIVAQKEFEDEELLKIKGIRTPAEYCWTCTPSVIKYAIKKYALDSCTYLDADLYFFLNPSVLIEEMGSNSILITEHRYTKRYDLSLTSGIYCVQFITFKNDVNGLQALNWWQESCNKWCYARFEDGKFGDQKYLDNWCNQFKGVHVLQNLGGGLAPWNIQQYQLSEKEIGLCGVELKRGIVFDVIFYHFHNFKFLNNEKLELGAYQLNKNILSLIYKPYLLHLEKINKKLMRLDDTYDFHGTSRIKLNWKSPLKVLKRYMNQTYNIYKKNYLIGLNDGIHH